MTKPKSLPAGFPDVMNNPFAMSDAGARAQAYWVAQGAALEHMRSYLDGWFARRSEAAASAADCCAQMMNGGGDLPATTQILTDWASASIERMRDDLQAHATLATRLVSEMTTTMSANGAPKPHRRKSHGDLAEGESGGRARPAADVR